MPKVLISDKLSPKAAEIFRERGLDVDFRPGIKNEELISAIKDADGLAIRSATTVTAELMDAAESLKVVGRAGIGVDNVDVDAATQRGVVVIHPFRVSAPHETGYKRHRVCQCTTIEPRLERQWGFLIN